MIVDRDAHGIGGLNHAGRHRDIRILGRRIARGMIVDEDQRRSVQFQRAADDLSRIDRNMIDRAARLFLVGNQDVPAVQIEDSKLLGRTMGHCGVAIIQQRVPARQDRPVHDPGTGHALRRRLDDLQFGDHGRSDTLDLVQTRRFGGQYPIEILENLDQSTSKRFHILPRDRAKQ